MAAISIAKRLLVAKQMLAKERFVRALRSCASVTINSKKYVDKEKPVGESV